MTDEIENFNLTFPYSLTLENFFHRHRFDVKRFATMHRSDGIFKLRNLFRTLHSGFFEFCMSDACPLLAPLRLLFPFLTPFYGNDGTKFSKKAERQLSLSSSRLI